MSRRAGQTGEDLACDFLEEEGYVLIERNFLTRFGEIDIIAKDKETLVFVEVKYRKDEGFGTAAEFVTKEKLRKIVKTASIYISDRGVGDGDWRIDVLAIDADSGVMDLIQNVYTEGIN